MQGAPCAPRQTIKLYTDGTRGALYSLLQSTLASSVYSAPLRVNIRYQGFVSLHPGYSTLSPIIFSTSQIDCSVSASGRNGSSSMTARTIITFGFKGTIRILLTTSYTAL